MMKSIIIFLGAMLFFGIGVFAQIEGEVTDQKNMSIANAVIVASNSTGKSVDSVKSDTSGLYVFRRLPLGKYKIEVKASGFVTSVFENIEIEKTTGPVDKWNDSYYAIRLDIIMKPLRVSK